MLSIFLLQLNDIEVEMKLSKSNIDNNDIESTTDEQQQQQQQRKHRHEYARLPSMLHHLDERVNKLEHKIAKVSRKRSLLEKRVVYEDHENLSHRVHILESIGRDLTIRLRNVSHEMQASGELVQSTLRMFELFEDRMIVNQSDSRRRLADVELEAARKAAELSRTRDELGNLKKAVQALSVSASKLQEKSDKQQNTLSRLNDTLQQTNGFSGTILKAENITKELEHVEDEYRKMVDSLPGNCVKKDGLTLLAPGPGAPLLAACRKGWIVVGRRVDGTVDFDRSWNDYAIGFGSPMNEFWAGNEALHRLSSDNCTRLRIELNDIDGNYWVANYEDFHVDDEASGYRLRVSGFSGNATDAMAYQNNMRFSAKDRDLDISSTDCAANYHGGWWFSHCQHANLNGRYSLGLTWYRSDRNEWMAVANTEISLQTKQQCL